MSMEFESLPEISAVVRLVTDLLRSDLGDGFDDEACHPDHPDHTFWAELNEKWFGLVNDWIERGWVNFPRVIADNEAEYAANG